MPYHPCCRHVEHTTRASRSCQESLKGPDIGPNVCRGRGIRSNETPRNPALGLFKENTEFLVCRSLTLPAAPPWVAGVIFFLLSLYPNKKKPVPYKKRLELINIWWIYEDQNINIEYIHPGRPAQLPGRLGKIVSLTPSFNGADGTD